MEKLIFADIDGTLIHKSNSYAGKLIPILEVARFISAEAVRLIEELQNQENRFALITGRRKSGFEEIGKVIPYDYAIIEHGCVILQGESFDRGWADLLHQSIGDLGKKNGPLWHYERQLIEEGYKTDSDGRFSTFRVFIDNPDNLTEEQKRHLEQKVRSEGKDLGITTTRNQSMLDVIPINGGKANAIKYLICKEGFSENQIVALGDDVNDLDMLAYATKVACPGNAKESVKSLVREKKGYISQFLDHNGTGDLLRFALSNW